MEYQEILEILRDHVIMVFGASLDHQLFESATFAAELELVDRVIEDQYNKKVLLNYLDKLYFVFNIISQQSLNYIIEELKTIVINGKTIEDDISIVSESSNSEDTEYSLVGTIHMINDIIGNFPGRIFSIREQIEPHGNSRDISRNQDYPRGP